MPKTKKLQYLHDKVKSKIIRLGYGEKYNHAGVYSIRIDRKLVYIGKATNMLNRLVDHILEIGRNEAREHKYAVLREAKDAGHKIDFDVLYYATSASPSAIEREICEKEGELIRAHTPPLNYKIPKQENYKSFTVNKSALSITLQELLK